MATSGSFNTSARVSGSYNTYAKFSWSQTSQSVANNTTTISWKLTGVTANAYQWIHVYAISVTVNGTNTGKSWSGDMYNGTEMASGTATISHNSDGTKTFSASASITQYSSSSTYSGSGSWALTAIPRKATVSTAPNFNDEASPTMTYENKAGTSATTLQGAIYLTDASTAIAGYRDLSKTGTSYTFSLTTAERTALRNAMTSANSITVRYYIKTVIGSSTYRDYKEATASIVNGNPTFSDFTYQDTNSTITAITGNDQYLVQGKSTLRAIISTANKATANKSATMSSYAATISGLTATGAYSSSEAVNIDFSSNAFTPGSQTLAVKAIDSRGNSTSVSKNVTVLAYSAPTINATATRLNNFENDTTLVVKGAYSPLTVGSTAKNAVSSVQYRYKKQSESTWSSWTAMSGLSQTSAGAYTTTNKVLELDNAYAWDIQVRTIDELETTTVSLVVSVGIPIFRIGTDGYVYNNEKRLIPYDEISKYTTHVGQVIMSTTLSTAAAVAAVYGGTWEAWGAGRVPVGVDPNDSDFNAPNKTGGAKTVTLTESEIPSHQHWASTSHNGNIVNAAGATSAIGTFSTNSDLKYSFRGYNAAADCFKTGATGGGQPHSNLQPYETVYMWLRIA